MADLAVTAANVSAVEPATNGTVIHNYIAAVAINPGQPVYENSAGNVDIARANAAPTAKFRGIALNKAGAGQAVDVLEKGRVAGFTLTSQAYGAPIYVSDTATGILGDSVGTTSVLVGRVVSAPDSTRTKLIDVIGPTA